MDGSDIDYPRRLAGEFKTVAPACQSLLLVVLALATRGCRELVDALAEDGCAGDIHVVIELPAQEEERVPGNLAPFDAALELHTDLAGYAGLASVCLGIVISATNIGTLGEVFEHCLGRGVPVRFRLASPGAGSRARDVADLDGYLQSERYHLVEFLEGLLAHVKPADVETRTYRALIGFLIKGESDPSILHSGPEVIRFRVESGQMQRVAEGWSVTVDRRLPLVSWSDFFRFRHDGSGAATAVSRPARPGRVRSLALAAAAKLGIESEIRGIGRWCLEPYRRIVSRRRFRQRVDRIAASTDVVAPWREASHGRRVLICGWYGTETLGDKAILAGVVQCLETALGDMQLILVSLHPYVSEMTREQMPELAETRIVTPMQAVGLVASADLVVFGGGPLMALGVLADMQAIFEVAKTNRVRTLIAGCGVGPLGPDWHNRSIRRILELSDLRIYRDERSRQLAAEIGVETRDDIVAEDPAFAWLQFQKDIVPVRGESERPVLLLGLRDFPYHAYARHLDEDACLAAKSNYERAVLDALDLLVVRNPNLLIKPLPMCTNHFGGDDRWFYRRLFRGRAGLAERLDASLLGAERAPVEYCAEFRTARVALVMRFHSLVFALGLGVPAVAIDYTLGRGKVHALAKRFNVPQQSLDQLSVDFLVVELQALLNNPVAQAPDFTPGFPDLIEARLPALFERRSA